MSEMTDAVPLNPKLAEVTARIVERSRNSRADYLARMTRPGPRVGAAT